MKQVVATALILLLLLFLLPLFFLDTGSTQATPEPQATLPLDRTVVSPSPTPVPAGPLDQERQIQVQLPDGTVCAMNMGDYLWRVVAAEMPASFELEALKAQAVAARTYAARKMDRATAAHPDANVCTDHTCCQAYITPEQAAANWGEQAPAYTVKVQTAVAGTDGVVAQYGGQLIDAVFFSSAAGRTVDAVEVWGNAVPYLTSVDSPEGEGVPNYHSTVTLTAREFKDKFLSAYPDAQLEGDPASWLGERTPNSAGGVGTLTVGGVTVGGGKLRALFGLRSANFTLSYAGDTFTFSVTGYGHGVGMSQYGANTLAQQGQTYDEILKWYYTGIDLTPAPAGGE